MGRAGGGSGGSRSRSSSGHSFGSRSSGGHRAGGGSSFGGSGFGHNDWGHHHHGHHHYHHGGYYRPYRGNEIVLTGWVGAVFGLIVMLFFGMIIFGMIYFSTHDTGNSSSYIPASNVYREKLELGYGYDNNCIIDELGWFDNIPATSSNLQYFYDQTGVQPYIVLRRYDETLVTDADKEAYAEQWYEDNIKNEGTFLYMYFAEEDTDNDVGYMVYVNGIQIGPVMDAEAIETFWAFIDSAWYTDMSTDEVFVYAFCNTADKIMPQDGVRNTSSNKTSSSNTSVWVNKEGLAFGGMLAVIIIVMLVFVMVLKRKQEKERAEETERILNTPLDRL